MFSTSFFQYIRSALSIKERSDLDNAKADIAALNSSTEKAAANIDYIAMMADVDIPIEEEGEENVV